MIKAERIPLGMALYLPEFWRLGYCGSPPRLWGFKADTGRIRGFTVGFTDRIGSWLHGVLKNCLNSRGSAVSIFSIFHIIQDAFKALDNGFVTAHCHFRWRVTF